MSMNKVVVLMGGKSAEREVSLRSGAAVAQGLKRKGYEVKEVDLNKKAIQEIMDYAPDVVFIAMHGKDGEDGHVQGVLEILEIPYTGSDVATSAICMNKLLSKKLLSYEGIPTAEFIIFDRRDGQSLEEIKQAALEKLGVPLVVKAATQGSSIGVSIVKDQAGIIPATELAFSYDKVIFMEKYIEGTEVTVTVVGNEQPVVYPLIEITSENEFFDFESKYTPGMCAHIIPARIDDAIKEKLELLAARIYRSLNCRGFARIDFMIDGEGRPYFLEINNIPGMTEMSLVPDSARAAGISFDDLVDHIIQLALQD